jgi:hypothetical protein
MRVVLDTNLLVSAFIHRQGPSGQILEAMRLGRFIPVYSVPLLIELVEVLSRPRLKEKYHIESEDVVALVNLLRLRGELVTPKRVISVCRDAKDNKFLEAAVAGRADALVSGDKDLLDLESFEGIPILQTVEFITRYF